jgi:hypothetical protein
VERGPTGVALAVIEARTVRPRRWVAVTVGDILCCTPSSSTTGIGELSDALEEHAVKDRSRRGVVKRWHRHLRHEPSVRTVTVTPDRVRLAPTAACGTGAAMSQPGSSPADQACLRLCVERRGFTGWIRSLHRLEEVPINPVGSLSADP